MTSISRSRTKHGTKLQLAVLGIFCLGAAGMGVWSELLADTTTSNFRGKQINAHFEIDGTSADVNGYENFVHGKDGSQTAWVQASGSHWDWSGASGFRNFSAGGAVAVSDIDVRVAQGSAQGSITATVPGTSSGWDIATGAWDWGSPRTVGIDVALVSVGDVGLEIGGNYYHTPGSIHLRNRYQSMSALDTIGVGSIKVDGVDFFPAGTATSWGALRDVKSGSVTSWN